MPSKSCRYCGLLGEENICPVFNLPIKDIDNMYCPQFNSVIESCQICGRQTLEPQVLIENEKPYVICGDCSSKTGTCQICEYGSLCDFETNPSPLPKAIMKQLRQGNQILQMQVKNPDRIRETCEKNCKCFDKENGCNKENNCCGYYITTLIKEENE